MRPRPNPTFPRPARVWPVHVQSSRKQGRCEPWSRWPANLNRSPGLAGSQPRQPKLQLVANSSHHPPWGLRFHWTSENRPCQGHRTQLTAHERQALARFAPRRPKRGLQPRRFWEGNVGPVLRRPDPSLCSGPPRLCRSVLSLRPAGCAGRTPRVRFLPPAKENPPGGGFSDLERVKGIEPSYAAWEAAVLPLNYTRVAADSSRFGGRGANAVCICGRFSVPCRHRWGSWDSACPG